MDSIADRESASLIRSSKLRAEIEKLKNASKDSTKPIAERIKLNDLAMQKEKELLGIEKGFMKEKLDAEISNLASKLQVQGLSTKQKEQQIREWLKLDDRQIEQYAKNNSRFANFVNKNEAEFQKLQKQKSEDFDKDAEFERETRRLQKEGASFKVEILKAEQDRLKSASEAKKQKNKQELEDAKKLKEEQLKLAKELADSQISDIQYALQLSKSTNDQKLAGVKLSIEQERDLRKQEAIDTYNFEIDKLAVLLENKQITSDKFAKESALKLQEKNTAIAIIEADASDKLNKQKLENEANFLADKIELAKNNIDETYRLESLQRERKMREELAVANLTEEQIKAIRDKYRQLDVEAEGKKLYEKQQKVLEWANTGQQILGDLNNFASALGQRELQEFEEQNRGKIGFDEEYAKKKAKIQRDEAIRAKALAALSVIVSTASAVIGALAPPPIGAGPIVGIPLAIAAGVSGAIQLAAILAAPIPSESGTPSVPSGTPPEPPQTGARVAVPQAAEGRYDVIGEQDRRRYSNVRYMGRARTGLVTTPTLYGEAGTELVIDAPTLRRLNTRAPGFNNFVLQNRTVPQRADGNYAPAQGAAPMADNTPVMVANLEATNQLISLLSDLKVSGIEAFILYDRLQREQRIYENSVKKGSIR